MYASIRSTAADSSLCEPVQRLRALVAPDRSGSATPHPPLLRATLVAVHVDVHALGIGRWHQLLPLVPVPMDEDDDKDEDMLREKRREGREMRTSKVDRTGLCGTRV